VPVTACRAKIKKKLDIDCGGELTRCAMQLYHIAQELVHNAVRHAQARHITISLSKTNKLLELSVSDDGKGFQPDSGEKEGYGLRIMRYRAAMTGCELSIESTPGKGSVARCVLRS
jgi:signal transduction histidine kinase